MREAVNTSIIAKIQTITYHNLATQKKINSKFFENNNIIHKKDLVFNLMMNYHLDLCKPKN